MSPARLAGTLVIGTLALAVPFGGLALPHAAGRQFANFSYAPPMLPHLRDDDGTWRRPFVYPLRLVNRLEHRFEEDRAHPVTLRWASDGALLSGDGPAGPWLPLGGDPLGRDILARLLLGARLSLGVSAAAAAGALLIGALLGAVAGFRGGRLDGLLMRSADFVLVLPAVYVVIVLRAALPLVLSTSQVFWTLAGVLALSGWPQPARGVRAIIRTERRQEYAEAALALGATPTRILLRHLLPATRSFLAAQLTLLLPAFILAEATLSFVGFGFSEPTPSWGVMLQDAAQASVLAETPWLAAPAAAIALSVLALHLLVQTRQAPPSSLPSATTTAKSIA
ncbi:MAG: ABC transporter permease [Acidobacteriota bacterium]